MIGMRLPTQRGLGGTLVMAVLSLALVACGSSSDGPSRLDGINNGNGGSAQNGNGTGTNGNGNGDNGNGDGDTESPSGFQLGYGVGDDFEQGAISVGIGDSTLASGGTTSLALSLVDDAGNLIAESLNASVTSDCILSGNAALTTLTDENGQARFEYQAQGCAGEDTVRASVAIDGVVLTASTTLTIDADSAQTIEFIEASPQFIGLQGMGRPTSSEISFRVVGRTGAPIQGAEVTFETNVKTEVASLVHGSGTTGDGGIVRTQLQSGSAAGVITVTARTQTETGDIIAAQSRQLVASTGVPVQNSMSLSASNLTPVSWDRDGVTSDITIRLGDQFNNPVPDGTAVYFTTSGGLIGGADSDPARAGCLTNNSACSVQWTSQSPRPHATSDFTIDPDTAALTCANGAEECRAGRVRILATTVGNESFIDINKSGMYDPGIDLFLTNGNCAPNVPTSSASNRTTACDDLGDAYLDANFNDAWDTDEEVDNPLGVREEGNGIYNGILCREEDEDAGHCSREPVTVRDHGTLVMTSLEPTLWGIPSNVTVVAEGTYRFRIAISDINGNGMPSGTSLSIDDRFVNNAEVDVFPDTIGGTGEPSSVLIVVKGTDEDDAPSGEPFLVIESQGEEGDSFTGYYSFTIND